MSYLPEEVINTVKSQVNIVELVGQYIQLSKRGTNYMASCPFHEDRSPSFSVSESKQIFKCFSCGRGGNVFSFLQEIEGVSFPEAVIKAADFAQVEIDERYQEVANEGTQTNHPLYIIHEKAADFYHYYLTQTNQGEGALTYLLDRQMAKDSIDEFRLGLAPSNSALLSQYLEKEGFNSKQLVESGIFYQTDQGELVDRFRGRLIIPLPDTRGKVVGFSGRVYVEGDKSAAKYLNSPETPIFKKGELLFNYEKGRLSIRNKHYALVAEGFMDVISLHQAGFTNVVASMGTSLTQSHLKQLSRVTKQIIFSFDGDSAGQKAISRAFDEGKGLKDVELKAVMIPNKQDPDEWIRMRGAQSFEQLINQSVTAYEFHKEFYKREVNLQDEHQLAQYIERLVTLIAQLNSPIEQQLRIQELAREYNVSESILNQQLNHQRVVEVDHYENDFQLPPDQGDFFYPDLDSQLGVSDQTALIILSKRAYNSEKEILFHLIYSQEAWQYIEALEAPPVFFHAFASKAYFALDKYYYEGNQLPLTGVIDYIEDRQVTNFISSLMWEQELLEFSPRIYDDCFKVINQEFVQQEINELRARMTEFQRNQDMAGVNESLLKIMKLTRQLKAQ